MHSRFEILISSVVKETGAIRIAKIRFENTEFRLQHCACRMLHTVFNTRLPGVFWLPRVCQLLMVFLRPDGDQEVRNIRVRLVVVRLNNSSEE